MDHAVTGGATAMARAQLGTRVGGWQERGAVDSIVVERAAVLSVWRAGLQRVLTDGPSATTYGRGPQQQPCTWPSPLVRCLGVWRTS